MRGSNLRSEALPGPRPVGVPMTPVVVPLSSLVELVGVPTTPAETVGALVRSAELGGAPMTPLEPEGNDDLNPDCPSSPSPGHSADLSQPPGGAPTPPPGTLPILDQRSTLEPRPSPVLRAVCRGPRDSAELKEMTLCRCSLWGQPRPTLRSPSSLLSLARDQCPGQECSGPLLPTAPVQK